MWTVHTYCGKRAILTFFRSRYLHKSLAFSSLSSLWCLTSQNGEPWRTYCGDAEAGKAEPRGSPEARKEAAAEAAEEIPGVAAPGQADFGHCAQKAEYCH